MDKTISISIGGFSFIVDDSAYEKLNKYLEEIKTSLENTEGIEEIISDVETRIAELLKEKLKGREVVELKDIEEVMQIMGRPDQFVEEEKVNQDTNAANSTSPVKKKLYRDPDDKMIGGVFAGIAHYFGIEPWIVRLIGLILFFADLPFTGSSIVIISYIILLVILPKAETATQKYEMFGETGDFETIKKNATSGSRNRAQSESVKGFFGVVFKVGLIFIGILLIITGISFAFSTIAVLFISITSIPIEFFGYIITQPWQEWFFKILLLILMVVPAILFILFGTRLIKHRTSVNKTFVYSLVGIWILAVISVGVLSISIANDFKRGVSITNKKMYSISKDTIQVNFTKNDFKYHVATWWVDAELDEFMIKNGIFYKNIEDDIEIRPSENGNTYVEVVAQSRGASTAVARENAEAIQYDYSANRKATITLNDFLTLSKTALFRGQNVEIILYIPKNKVVHFHNVDDVIFYDSEYNSNVSQGGHNKYFKWQKGRFRCLNCTEGITRNTSFSHVEFSDDGIYIQNKEESVIINEDGIYISDQDDKE